MTESEAPLVSALLHELDLGSSVAEHDAALQKYFVETSTFRTLIQDRADVVAGDKGTGKTALFRILKERFASFDDLRDVEVVAAFNPAGTPVFQRLLDAGELSEDQYIGVWKAYFLALAGNWLLQLYDGEMTDTQRRLDALLRDVGLRAADDTPQTIFSQVVNRLRRLFRIKSIEQTTTFTQDGMPILTAKLELGGEGEDTVADLVRHDDALRLLQEALAEADLKIWLVVDRLDEAFQGRPAVERPALRGLFRVYLDSLEFGNLHLKLFVRNDLFARIIEGGFVNLTHVNARRIDISWNEDDLYDLVIRRVRESPKFLEIMDLDEQCTDEDVWNALVPLQVDLGSRKPVTWQWIMSRVRDGNGVKPPRNLIDLILKARAHQLRIEERSPRRLERGKPLITSEALKRGLEALSAERVQDTLLAEAGEHAHLVERFRGGKAEHNAESLHALLGDSSESDTKILRSIGFLEPAGINFKVPMLYRGGLSITQGKAFASDGPAESPDDDD